MDFDCCDGLPPVGSSGFAAQQAVSAWGGGQSAASTSGREDSSEAIPVVALQSGQEEEQAVGYPGSGALAWMEEVLAGTGDRKANKKDTPKCVLFAST